MRMMAFPPVPDVLINDAAQALGAHQITKITTGSYGQHWWRTRLIEYNIWEEPDSDCNCLFLHTQLGYVLVLTINPEMPIAGHVTGVALSTQGNLGHIRDVEGMEPMGPVEDLHDWDTSEDDEQDEEDEEDAVARLQESDTWDTDNGSRASFDNYAFRIWFDHGHAHVSFAHPRGRGRRPATSPTLRIITPQKYTALRDPTTDVALDSVIERIVARNPHAADWLPMRFSGHTDMFNTLFRAPPATTQET